MLDFVTGGAYLHADCGWVTASNRIELGPFLNSISGRADDIQKLLCQAPASALGQRVGFDAITGTAGDMVTLSFNENSMSVRRNADVNKFIRQLEKRFIEIEQVLEQAEEIGSSINRRPYCDFINEIADTDLALVEVHGFGFFIDGKLRFQLSSEVLLVRQREPGRFVHEFDPSAPRKTRAN